MMKSISLWWVTMVLLTGVTSGYRRLPNLSPRIIHTSTTQQQPAPLKATTTTSSSLPIQERKLTTRASSNVLLPEDSNLIRGSLPNGLRYLLLPHQDSTSNNGRLEARLEILSGSTVETDKQLGLAHLLEHVVFMDNPFRKQLSMRGVHTNAYTDFHQTVFTSSSTQLNTPTSTPLSLSPSQSTSGPSSLNTLSSSKSDKGDKQSAAVLPLILKSFRDIFTFGQGIESNHMEGQKGVCSRNANNSTSPEVWKDCVQRLQKEQAAILSESNLVNSVKYRQESDILSSLHQENIISKRFPLGDVKKMQQYTPDDLLHFHRQHYTPQNAILYLTGDIHEDNNNHSAIERIIHETFANIPSGKDQADMSFSPKMSSVSRSLPHFQHKWSSNMTETQAIFDQNNRLKELQTPGNTSTSSVMTGKKGGSIRSRVSHRIRSWIAALSMNKSPKRQFPTAIILKQNYSDQLVTICVFAKRPIETINSVERFRNSLMRKIVLNALSIRWVFCTSMYVPCDYLLYLPLFVSLLITSVLCNH
jgi:hypothetical protein